ncbi:MAG TPA: hypothetical protein VFO24_00670 [Usitatibacter sp.]|nr:hypothetical protein [Usitatibacter sp.]
MRLSRAQRDVLRQIQRQRVYMHYASVGGRRVWGGAKSQTLRVLVRLEMIKNICLIGDEFIGPFRPYAHLYVITSAGVKALRQ